MRESLQGEPKLKTRCKMFFGMHHIHPPLHLLKRAETVKYNPQICRNFKQMRDDNWPMDEASASTASYYMAAAPAIAWTLGGLLCHCRTDGD
jgi:hypothetical protein